MTERLHFHFHRTYTDRTYLTNITLCCLRTHTYIQIWIYIYFCIPRGFPVPLLDPSGWKVWCGAKDFIFLGSKITADGDCSHEMKRYLFLGRKATTNLDCVLKSRDMTLPTKVHIVKAMVFPVVMYGCKSWTIKKAEHERTDAFKLWCWRRLLRVPWTVRTANQSILKEINPD